MAFPQSAVPVVVEIAPGADPTANPGTWSWTDITSRVRLADRISIVTGRQNEATAIDPSRCTMLLDNTAGDFTPRNPYGQWYGSLGKNTPLRVRVLRGADVFGRTVSSGWGTADSGQAWTTSGGSASDYSLSSGAGRHSHGTSNVLRRSVLGVALADVEQMVDASTPVLITGAALVTGVLARYQDSSNYYWLRVEFDHDSTDVVLKISKRVGGVSTDIAVLDPVPSLAYAAGTPLRMRAQVLGNQLAIKAWAASGSEPSGWQLETTDDDLTAAGATGVQSWLVGGNTNTLPLVVSFDNYTAHVDRFAGFVSSWPPRWDPSEQNQTVPIQADGVLRRLGQGSPPVRSALRRTLAAAAPAAYWPGEDGAAARRLASAIAGHPPMAVTGSAQFVPIADYTGSTVTLRYGSSALVDLSAGGRLSAQVPADVTAATANVWTVHVRGDVNPAVIGGDFVLAEWTSPGGTYVRWRIVVTAADSKLIGYNAAGSATTLVTGGLPLGLAQWSVSASLAGGTVFVTYRSDFDGSTSFAGTLGGVASIGSNPTGQTASAQVTVGHFAIWASDDEPPSNADSTADEYGRTIRSVGLSAMYEPAHSRLARLCAEDGVRLAIPAVPEYAAARMGWQEPGTPLDLYRQFEDTDQGVLYELGHGLGYLPRNGRYNRSTALTLDYAAGQVAPPLEPVDDDQLLRNRVTVSRIDGSEATAEDPVSVAAAGPYATSYAISVAATFGGPDDEMLPDQAGWRLRISTSDEMRWPLIRVNLARSPELIDGVVSCRVQSRMAVSNPPQVVVGDIIDVLVEGYAETIGYTDWQVEFNTSPARVWDVATADGEQRVAADGSTLAADITAGATSMLLSSTDTNGIWTQDPTDFPLPIRVGGERVTASTIAATVSDAFGRTTSSGWGTADSGQAWTVEGTASAYSTTGSLARISTSVTDNLYLAHIDTGATDHEVRGSVTVPVVPSGGAVSARVAGRLTDASNYYEARILIATSGATTLQILSRVAGAGASVSSALTVGTHTAGATWTLALNVSGSTLRAKAWKATDPVPAAWQVSGTDTSLTAGTRVGCLVRRESGNTNGTTNIDWDNVSVPNPQTVTLTARGVNGVNRSWSAGTDVDVWSPGIVAL